MTHHTVSVVKTQQDEPMYENQMISKSRFKKLDHMQLLLEIFLTDQTIKLFIGLLKCLKELGINAIELMPVIDGSLLLVMRLHFSLRRKFYRT